MERNALWFFDAEQKDLVCGVDEAGRGPLAGPVTAACACFLAPVDIPYLNDSKKLTEKRREAVFEQLIVCPEFRFGIGMASPEEIDSINILNATFLAMNRAYAQMKEKMLLQGEILPALALVDGNRNPRLPLPVKLVVKGDSKSASIAAASVLAKVTRDRYMMMLAEKYPQYSLEKHKGYPTPLHYQCIAEYGISEIHRKSFLKNLDDHIDPGRKKLPARPTGPLGEEYTAQHLIRQGYRIEARGWSWAGGEIDIIAFKDGILAFVEVKTRSAHALISPAEAVTPAKRARIIKTALCYLQRYPDKTIQPRFDVAEVQTVKNGNEYRIAGFEYTEAAFDGSGRL